MYVYFDVETTGVAKDDELLEIAILDDEKVLLHSYVKPINKSSWPNAQRVNNISPEMVRDAPTLDMLKEQISAAVRGKIVIAYNIAFDSRFVDLSEAAGTGCAMKSFSQKQGLNKNVKLIDAAAATGFEWKGAAHTAVADTEACRHVWRSIYPMELDPKEPIFPLAYQYKPKSNRYVSIVETFEQDEFLYILENERWKSDISFNWSGGYGTYSITRKTKKVSIEVIESFYFDPEKPNSLKMYAQEPENAKLNRTWKVRIRPQEPEADNKEFIEIENMSDALQQLLEDKIHSDAKSLDMSFIRKTHAIDMTKQVSTLSNWQESHDKYRQAIMRKEDSETIKKLRENFLLAAGIKKVKWMTWI